MNSNDSYFMCYHNYNKNHFLCVAFQATKKDAESIPRPQNYLAFHLFYSSTLSVTLLHLINRIADFINLLIEHSFLSLC